MSDRIDLLSGVKQGGVLSPLLFTLYVDVVLDKLERSGVGCYINYNCCNSYMYADDIILISISVTDLQRLFNICSEVFVNLDLPVNLDKCHCMRIGPRFNMPCKPLTIGNSTVKWVDKIQYLGITLCRSKSFVCEWRESKGKFYMSVNTILGRLGTNGSIDVILELIKSQAVPSLIYGIASSALTSSEIKSFCNAYDNIFRKIFHTYDCKIIAYCQWYCGFWPFQLLYNYHRFKFLDSLIKSNRLNRRADVDKADVLDYMNILNKYNIEDKDSNAKIRFRFWKYFESILS